ncbi:DUF5133 domain-containing protein [Streptomyces sp. NPDC004610]|uniref:DUF5133 domain-containing protein n=1 Tax=unclassified Streptomyces TaxID=2593676 RepID=UPI0033B6E6AA
MPRSDPQAVRELLTRYAALRIALAERERPVVRRELARVSRLLCAATGTGDVREAVTRADLLLTAAAPDAIRASRRPAGGDGVPVVAR